jgi:ABC-2 type transport system ATP-binding protein
VLTLTHLKKDFDGNRAVDDVSFKVEQGDVFGFLGPNGAGKTTTIRMIMGIIQQDSGLIELNGENINHLSRETLGYLPEDRGLYQKQKLEETIIYFAILRGLEKVEAKKQTGIWLERFGLQDQGNRKIEELSKGNQQKIQFILSLIHDPSLLILDEPFTGLDPLNQLLLKEIIQEKRDEGKTILFSTHQMEQVERLCSNICLINQGKIILSGALDDIRHSHSSDAVNVKFTGELNHEKVRTFFSEIEINESSLSGILSKKSKDFLSWINESVQVESYQIHIPSLEQIFIEEVKKAS